MKKITQIMGLTNDQRAVTLTELLVATAILAIIMLPMYNVLQVAMKSWKFEDTRAEVVQNARIAMERMTHEIREVRQIDDSVPENWSQTKLRFWWKDNYNPDGLPDSQEWVTYEWSELDLKLNRTAYDPVSLTMVTEPVADYVQNFSIEYRDSSGGTPATADLIHLITINLTIENKGHSATVRVSLHPRNI